MAQVNGHDANQQHSTDEEAAITEIRELASRMKTVGDSVSVLERVKGDDLPFEQKTHTLMLEGIDKITTQWIGQLDHVRQNTHIVEKMVVAQAAKVKSEITKLHLLGVQAMKEAERGDEVTRSLGEQIDAMMEEQGVLTH